MTVGELRILLSNYHNNELVGIEAPGTGRNVRAITGLSEQRVAWRNELDGIVSEGSGVYSVVLGKS